jgi:hypothetical protein
MGVINMAPGEAGGGGGGPLERIEPLPPNESPEVRKLRGGLEEAGFRLGEVVKRLGSLGRHANVLITGPSASKKSTILGVMRHLVESSGIQSEKMKEGKVSTLVNPKGSVLFEAAAHGTEVVFWESTTVTPPKAQDIDFYLEIQGSPGVRVNRLSEKTGSYEFALQVVETSQRGQKVPGREPDMVLDTDAIGIDMEHSGWVTRRLQDGWRKSLEGSGIPVPKDEENPALQSKIATLRKIGMDRQLSAGQVEFIAVRLRPESIIRLKDGRDAVYLPRISLIVGERFTQRIPIEAVEVADPPPTEPADTTALGPDSYMRFIPPTRHSFYAVSEKPTGLTLDAISTPNSWLTTKK